MTSTPSNAASNNNESADQFAQRVAQEMWAGDRATRHLGMELVECRAGYCKMRMRVRPEFTNGHRICHGGYMFLLADSAFAFACNSFNQRAVAAGCSIDFLAAVMEGDELTAEAQKTHQGKRAGLYDVRVSNSAGETVALMRGRSATIKGTILADEAVRL